jgi:parvulin-like peptidyl-prolyl isomerase
MGSFGLLRYAALTVTLVRRSAAFAAALVVGAGVLAGCTGATPYAAFVNGTTISQSTLLRELHALGGNAGFVAAYNSNVQQAASQGQRLPAMFGSGTASQTFSQGFTAIVLNTDIQAQLIHEEVVRRHIEPSAVEIAAATAAAQAQFPNTPDNKPVFPAFDAWFQQEYKTRAAEQATLANALAPSAKDATQIKQFYNLNPTNFITNQCVSHILVSTQGEAAAIRARIVAGADFAEQAKRYSTDTGSAAKGGQLGCAGPGQFVADFEQVANTIPVNQLSQPIHTQFGWHLIKVTSRQEQPLDATNTTRIQQYLQQNPVSMFIPPALIQAQVKVNPAYGRWDPLQPAVVPPPAPPSNSGAPSAVTSTTLPTSVTQSPGSPSSQAPATGAGATPTSTP